MVMIIIFLKAIILTFYIHVHLYFQLDSATSLIQAAKNLMNAVVLTVKACYVASTKVNISHH